MIPLITNLLTQLLTIMLLKNDHPVTSIFGPISAGIFSILPILLLILIIFMFVGFFLISRKASLNTHSELMHRQLDMINRSLRHMDEVESKLDRLVALIENHINTERHKED